jgi:tight adherence protein B
VTASPILVLAVLLLAVLVWPGSHLRLRARLRRLAAPSEAGLQRPRLPVPAVAAVLGTVVAAAVSTPLVALIAALLAGLSARSWSRRRRAEAESDGLLALTRGLGALGADLRSGRFLESASRAAATACGDQAVGRALESAIRSGEVGVGESHGEPSGLLAASLERVAAAVALSARTGCSLADVVTAVEDDLRARHRAELELRAATAAPRAAAFLLAGLPVLGLAMGSGVGADPWRVLTTTGTGQVLLVAGVALELAGIAWSGRLVRRALR